MPPPKSLRDRIAELRKEANLAQARQDRSGELRAIQKLVDLCAETGDLELVRGFVGRARDLHLLAGRRFDVARMDELDGALGLREGDPSAPQRLIEAAAAFAAIGRHGEAGRCHARRAAGALKAGDLSAADSALVDAANAASHHDDLDRAVDALRFRLLIAQLDGRPVDAADVLYNMLFLLSEAAGPSAALELRCGLAGFTANRVLGPDLLGDWLERRIEAEAMAGRAPLAGWRHLDEIEVLSRDGWLGPALESAEAAIAAGIPDSPALAVLGALGRARVRERSGAWDARRVELQTVRVALGASAGARYALDLAIASVTERPRPVTD
jgi:hypothetical protein